MKISKEMTEDIFQVVEILVAFTTKYLKDAQMLQEKYNTPAKFMKLEGTDYSFYHIFREYASAANMVCLILNAYPDEIFAKDLQKFIKNHMILFSIHGKKEAKLYELSLEEFNQEQIKHKDT